MAFRGVRRLYIVRAERAATAQRVAKQRTNAPLTNTKSSIWGNVFGELGMCASKIIENFLQFVLPRLEHRVTHHYLSVV